MSNNDFKKFSDLRRGRHRLLLRIFFPFRVDFRCFPDFFGFFGFMANDTFGILITNFFGVFDSFIFGIDFFKLLPIFSKTFGFFSHSDLLIGFLGFFLTGPFGVVLVDCFLPLFFFIFTIAAPNSLGGLTELHFGWRALVMLGPGGAATTDLDS